MGRLAPRRRLVALLGLLLVVVGVVVYVAVDPLDPLAHYDQSGLHLDYPRDWRMTGPGPILSTGPTSAVAFLLIGDVHRSCTPYGCPPPSLGQDSAFLEFGWYFTIGPAGDWPPTDASEVLTIGGQSAALLVRGTDPVDLTWSVRTFQRGQGGFWLHALIRGPDTGRLRGQIEEMLKTVRFPASPTPSPSVLPAATPSPQYTPSPEHTPSPQHTSPVTARV